MMKLNFKCGFYSFVNQKQLGSYILCKYLHLQKREICTVFLFTIMYYRSRSETHSQLFATPRTSSPWNSPGQNTEVVSLCLIQRIFPTQESNPCLPHCRWILYQLSHKGNNFSIAVLQIDSSVPSVQFHIYALVYDIYLSLVPQCSLQHCLQQLEHGSNLDVHRQMNG